MSMRIFLYANVGSSDGFVYQDGKVTKMTWKTTPHVAYSVFDKDGEEIKLNPGKVWITMLPTGTQ